MASVDRGLTTLQPPPSIKPVSFDSDRGNTFSALFGSPGGVPSLPPVYKMTGLLAGVPESWVSFYAPNTTPPSGHTLTNITYVVLYGGTSY